MTARKLLLLEDDKPLATLTKEYLEQHDFTVVHCLTIETALKTLHGQHFDLILCDIMLPGISGFAGARLLQAEFNCPLLFLSALTEYQDQIKGLSLGATDYILKPVRPELLLAKVNANLRKQSPFINDTFTLGDLTFKRTEQSLSWPKGQQKFTTKEYDLLWILAINCNHTLTRESLFEQSVGRPYDGLDRAIDLRISRLRKTLNECHIEDLELVTVHGKGYRLNYRY